MDKPSDPPTHKMPTDPAVPSESKKRKLNEHDANQTISASSILSTIKEAMPDNLYNANSSAYPKTFLIQTISYSDALAAIQNLTAYSFSSLLRRTHNVYGRNVATDDVRITQFTTGFAF